MLPSQFSSLYTKIDAALSLRQKGVLGSRLWLMKKLTPDQSVENNCTQTQPLTFQPFACACTAQQDPENLEEGGAEIEY